MKIIKKDKLPDQGKLILIYSDTGVGKTTSALQSAPDPILYIATEPRNPKVSIDAAKRPDLDLDLVFYDSWQDTMDFLADDKNTKRHNTIIADSFTYLMNVSLSSEIENEAFDSRSDAEKKIKPLVNRAKMSPEGYGGLSSQMFRMMKILGQLSTKGKVVIITALMQETPKWNRELAAAPAFKGREFPNNMPGFFDLIGFVQTRHDENGEIVYPPWVSFESPDGSFMAKYTGTGKRRAGPLDFSKILKA